MARTSCYLTIADENGYVLETVEGLEEYDLSKPLARAEIMESIREAVETRQNERAKEQKAKA